MRWGPDPVHVAWMDVTNEAWLASVMKAPLALSCYGCIAAATQAAQVPMFDGRVVAKDRAHGLGMNGLEGIRSWCR